MWSLIVKVEWHWKGLVPVVVIEWCFDNLTAIITVKWESWLPQKRMVKKNCREIVNLSRKYSEPCYKISDPLWWLPTSMVLTLFQDTWGLPTSWLCYEHQKLRHHEGSLLFLWHPFLVHELQICTGKHTLHLWWGSPGNKTIMEEYGYNYPLTVWFLTCDNNYSSFNLSVCLW